ncbi:hypothetical protein [Succinimonas amylolytica]|uniref:hypothetical protein n=1 Tax=Succinimonas amylolytica TaxID=83769 RepID=UPI0012FC7385|nr:hypothetical protein [Succinimonas amylolytica]
MARSDLFVSDTDQRFSVVSGEVFVRYGSGVLFSGMLFLLSSFGIAASESGWSFNRAGDTVYMQHGQYGSLMLEYRYSLDAYRFIHALEEHENCRVVEKEYYVKAENCRGFRVIEAVQSARILGEDNPSGIYYLNPKDKAGLEQLYFVVASLSGNRDGRFSEFLDFLSGWKLELSPREAVIREEQTRVEQLRDEYDQIDYWEYHVKKPGVYTYTFSHGKTGLRIIFENSGYLIDGDTIQNVSQRLSRKYGCNAPAQVPEAFFKNEQETGDRKKQEMKFPYTELLSMECLNNIRVFVADNGGGIFYDYVVKLPTPPADLKTQEPVSEGKSSGTSQTAAKTPDKASETGSGQNPLPASAGKGSTPEAGGADSTGDSPAEKARSAEGSGAEEVSQKAGSEGLNASPENESGDSRQEEYDLLIQEFIRKTEIFNPAL